MRKKLSKLSTETVKSDLNSKVSNGQIDVDHDFM